MFIFASGTLVCCFIALSVADPEQDQIEYTKKVSEDFRVKYPNAVTYKDAEEVAERIREKDHLVMFFMPWSGHCRALLPVFDRLAEKYNKGDDIVLARVDCHDLDLADACKEHEIYGHPTLLLFKKDDDEPIRCEERLYEDMDKFINKHLELPEALSTHFEGEDEAEDEPIPHPPGTGYITELDDQTFVSFIADGSHMVEFYATASTNCQAFASVWQALADSFVHQTALKFSRIECTKATETCKKYNIERFPTVTFFNNGHGVQEYKGQKSHKMLKIFASSMLTFLSNREEFERNEKKRIQEMEVDNDDDEEVSVLTLTQRLAIGSQFVFFYDSKCNFCKEFMIEWKKLDKHYKTEGRSPVTIRKVNCIKNFEACSSEKIYSYPTLVFYKDGVRLDVYHGPRDYHNMREFSEAMHRKSVYKNEPEEISHVMVLAPTNFEFYIKSKKFVFVKFYKAWCIHCQNIAPTWEEFATKFSRYDNVVIAEVDCALYDQPLCQRYEVAGYPSLYLFKDGKQLDLYTGPHDLESLHTYLSSYISLANYADEEPASPRYTSHMEL